MNDSLSPFLLLLHRLESADPLLREQHPFTPLCLRPQVSGAETCWLCRRPLGRRVEWHHPVPKSRGGRETVPVHPICHRTIHVTIGNAGLARLYAEPDRLRAHPDIARFVDWIAGKPPDFHAPTRRRG